MSNNTAAIAYENNMTVPHQSNVTYCRKLLENSIQVKEHGFR